MIRRLSLSIACLLLGAGCALGADATVTYLQSAEDTGNTSSYTFSSQNLGSASPGRHIVVGVAARYSVDCALTSVTVGGVSATIIGQRSAPGPENLTALAIAAVPTGTTGDVVLTFSAESLRGSIFLYSLDSIGSATPVDVPTSATDGSTASAAIDVPAGGVVIGVAVRQGTATTSDWVGISEDDHREVETQISTTCASGSFATAQNDLSVSVAFGSGGSGSEFMTVAAWPGVAADPTTYYLLRGAGGKARGRNGKILGIVR